MKNLIVYLIPVLLYVSGCRPENAGLKMPDTRVWVDKLSVQEIGYTHAMLQGEIILGKNARLDSMVIEMATNNGFNPLLRQVSVVSTEKNLALSLDSLTANKKYFIRVAIYSGAGLHYSEGISFQTPDYGVPTILTEQPGDITFESAITNGRILSLNGLALEEYGFLVNEGGQVPTLSNYQFKYTFPTPQQSPALVTNTFEDLIFGKTYTYVFYARNSRGVAYGESVSFTTLPYPTLQIETGQAGEITSSFVRIRNNQIVNDTTGLTIITRSVLLSTDNPPVEANSSTLSGVINPSNTNLYDGSIGNLSPGTTYYYRARVETPGGYNYGQVKAFTTPGL